MRVFKFGGASVKDASGVRNMVSVLQQVGHDNLVIVISAMGKMTNAFERIVSCYKTDSEELPSAVQYVKTYHFTLLEELFEDKNDEVYSQANELFRSLQQFLTKNTNTNYSYVYDQVVPYGELLSTTIISAYLNTQNIKNTWLDVRTVLQTDDKYQDATVDWTATEQRIKKEVDVNSTTITQGFLGADLNHNTTTLGREGSDYTAAIFAYCLNATSVTIWKDVPGVLNADPRYFKNTALLEKIPYEEAIELAFYGASVIHPKTLQPIQKKQIPLYVKSFVNPLNKGTSVGNYEQLSPFIPCYIVKKNQVLLSLSSLDFSFIVEENISEIFSVLHQNKLKVDVIQNSAISFMVCVHDLYGSIDTAIQELSLKFKVSCHKKVALYTIRHANSTDLPVIIQDRELLFKQQHKTTLQIIVKE